MGNENEPTATGLVARVEVAQATIEAAKDAPILSKPALVQGAVVEAVSVLREVAAEVEALREARDHA